MKLSKGDDVRFSCHDVIVGEMLDQCEHGGALMPLWGIRSKSSQSPVAAPIAGNERQTNWWLLRSLGRVWRDMPMNLGVDWVGGEEG
jgi:hypothetical protein